MKFTPLSSLLHGGIKPFPAGDPQLLVPSENLRVDPLFRPEAAENLRALLRTDNPSSHWFLRAFVSLILSHPVSRAIIPHCPWREDVHLWEPPATQHEGSGRLLKWPPSLHWTGRVVSHSNGVGQVKITGDGGHGGMFPFHTGGGKVVVDNLPSDWPLPPVFDGSGPPENGETLFVYYSEPPEADWEHLAVLLTENEKAQNEINTAGAGELFWSETQPRYKAAIAAASCAALTYRI